MYVYIYIYKCTHTHIYIYIYDGLHIRWYDSAVGCSRLKRFPREPHDSVVILCAHCATEAMQIFHAFPCYAHLRYLEWHEHSLRAFSHRQSWPGGFSGFSGLGDGLLRVFGDLLWSSSFAFPNGWPLIQNSWSFCHAPQVLKSMAASGFLVPLLRAYSMVSTAMKQNNMLNTAIEPLHLGWIGQLNATDVFAAPLAGWLSPMAVGACSPPFLSAPKTAKPLNRWLKPFQHPSATCSLDSDSAPSLRGMISWICLLCKLERRAFTKLLGFWEF